jgi:hypothetical protein
MAASGSVPLLVRLVVHQDEVAALAVEELHGRALDDGLLDVLAGPEGLLDDLAGLDLLELGAHHRAALAGLVVVPVDDLLELAVEEEGHAVLEVVGRDHGGALGVS